MMKKQNASPNPFPAAAPAPSQSRSNPMPASNVDQRRSFIAQDAPDSEYRSEPMQSKSFRLLQKLTEGIEDGMQHDSC